MREEFRTPFWRAAFESLPRVVQRRYLPQLQAGERFELALDAAIRLCSRAGKSLARLLQASPRTSAH